MKNSIDEFFNDVSFDDYSLENPCAELITFDISANPGFSRASLYYKYLECSEQLARELILYSRKTK